MPRRLPWRSVEGGNYRKDQAMAPRVDPVLSDEAMPPRVDVVVVGGGIIGTSTALFLTE